MKYIVYTDGSCIKNPNGPGSYCAIIYNNMQPTILTSYEPSTTNQRMEMMGVISALRYIPPDSDIEICTDSAYIYNCMVEQWFKKWELNKWKNSKGEDVANKDLWATMLDLIAAHHSVKFIKVKGHSTNIFNNKCDELARDIINFTQTVERLRVDKYNNKNV